MGVKMEYGQLLTTRVVEHVELTISKTDNPIRKEFPLAPIKKIATLVLSLSLSLSRSLPSFFFNYEWKTFKDRAYLNV